MCRKRPFATGGRGRRPASTAVCRIPCLILCLADALRGTSAFALLALLAPTRCVRGSGYSSVHLAAVPNLHDEDAQRAVLDAGNDAVIADPVF